ncbi:DNA methyltransferase [Vulcanisaeta souniana]|uniref:DNA methyltransferase n=1 Tax=Vulcanisaeta souniana TaxID=164452 RepID=UPI000B1F0B3B|nr:DNA methyltransferase [Vulcanisaeta souniana]
MREVGFSEYLEFVSRNRVIHIEDQEISLEPIRLSVYCLIPRSSLMFQPRYGAFPGGVPGLRTRVITEATGPPQIPRALILMYTNKGDTILDSMVGSGTTCIEAKLLGRNCIGVDVNYNAVMLTLHRLYWLEESIKQHSSADLVPL